MNGAMTCFYAPYNGKKPAALSINGHKIIVLAEDQASVSSALDVFGADSVKKLKVGETAREQRVLFEKLAKSVDGGVVIAPQNSNVLDMIRDLESELPWLQ